MIASILILADAAAGLSPMPGFLAGCWEQRGDGKSWTEECWTMPRGGLMLGTASDGSGDTVRHWEWMRISRAADGVLTFHASPKGAPAVEFRAVKADSSSVTFVSAGHDYPQRVRYQHTADGIEAEISMADGSKPNRWSYKRTSSPAR